MDESGHDHKNTPLEVRGGVAIRDSKIWDFVKGWEEAKRFAFGDIIDRTDIEIKGSKLLEARTFKQANQISEWLRPHDRHKAVARLLTQKRQGIKPSKRDFVAYGQAKLIMADRIFELIKSHDGKIFASLIPCGVRRPKDYKFDHFLRRDQIYLQERYFNFLEGQQEHGLFVMDQIEVTEDRRFVRRLNDYYRNTQNGRERTQWIVPTPLFVDSQLAVGVQAADVVLYCINYGYRRHEWGFTGLTRQEIQQRYGGLIHKFRYEGDVYNEGKVYTSYGIVYVPDPYATA